MNYIKALDELRDYIEELERELEDSRKIIEEMNDHITELEQKAGL